MALGEILAGPAGRLLTLALFHFVWQGAAVAAALIVVVELGGIRRATMRYACSLAALGGMMLCPLVTLAWFSFRSDASAASAVHSTVDSIIPLAGSRALSSRLESLQPVALAAWLAGVTVFSG